MRKRTLAWIVFTAGMVGATGVMAAQRDVHEVMDAHAEAIIASDPEARTTLGIADDGRDELSAQLTDASLQRREFLRSELARMRSEIEAFDRDALPPQQRWSRDMAVWLYAAQGDLLAFQWSPPWIFPYAVDQLFSAPVLLPQFMENHHDLSDETGARNYIARLEAMAVKLDQIITVMDMQASHGVVPPRVALDGLAGQIRSLLEPEPAQSPFTASFTRRVEQVDAIGEERRAELTAEVVDAVRQHVNPAYARLLQRLEKAKQDMPHSRGVWSLPQGDAYYDAALRWNTSIDISAEEIHRIGLEEVARIEAAKDAILRAQGMDEGTVTQRIAALAREDRFRYEDSAAGREELLGDIRRLTDGIQPRIPDYFSRTPEQPMEVRPVPAYAEDTAPGGYYYPPALDGSRGGIFFINLGDMDANTRFSVPTLTYHEGTPGHHFQIALGQTLDDLPFLRRNLNPSAFTEGWALYAEQLVKEMGVYEGDPWGDLGRLQAEMFRAVRLVVDTGLHRLRWTPEQAVEYMVGKTGMTEAEVRIEINRYLVMPGQATSYKVGHLRMLALRERARDALGEDFDIRAFHDVVLGNGALPLEVLEGVVEEWIASQKAS